MIAPNDDEVELVEVNRAAFVFRPEQPMIDWLNTVFPGDRHPLAQLREDLTVFLLPVDAAELCEEYLQKVYMPIWDELLMAWYTLEDGWPQDRSYAEFKRWFTPVLHSMVFDVQADEEFFEADDELFE